jgi:hypothetical protein
LAEHVGSIRIENDLQETLSIAQIDENYTTVIATTMSPASHRHCLTGHGAVYLTAIMSTHS